MNHKDVDWLLGRKFVANFRVVRIAAGAADDPTRTVSLLAFGERAEISFGELQTLIESGLVMESGEGEVMA